MGFASPEICRSCIIGEDRGKKRHKDIYKVLDKKHGFRQKTYRIWTCARSSSYVPSMLLLVYPPGFRQKTLRPLTYIDRKAYADKKEKNSVEETKKHRHVSETKSA